MVVTDQAVRGYTAIWTMWTNWGQVRGGMNYDPDDAVALVMPGFIGGPAGGGAQLGVLANDLKHIFRVADGHVAPRVLSQQRFLNLFRMVASNPTNLRTHPNPAKAANGVAYYLQNFRNGQVWVEVRNGLIRDAGVNRPGFFR